MDLVINFHVIDSTNIGDFLSAPVKYFEFPGAKVIKLDIRNTDDFVANYQTYSEAYERITIIVGGGGLLFPRFLENFQALQKLSQAHSKIQLIAWGIGQQVYKLTQESIETYKDFPYPDYLDAFDKVGIRDINCYTEKSSWLPCVSCMHPAFDQKREIKHEFVVFSHKKFQIQMDGLPRMTNESQDFEETLNFLASGETILTSSYHGAYWGTLLGRKVLAFPFTSKFYLLQHQPALYPIRKWKQSAQQFKLLGKVLYEKRNNSKFTCDLSNWRSVVNDAKAYPNSLADCRERTQAYYSEVLKLTAGQPV